MKNHYSQAKVDVNRIYKLLRFLRDAKSRFYQFFDNIEEFFKRCQEIGDDELEKIVDVIQTLTEKVRINVVSDESLLR